MLDFHNDPTKKHVFSRIFGNPTKTRVKTHGNLRKQGREAH